MEQFPKSTKVEPKVEAKVEAKAVSTRPSAPTVGAVGGAEVPATLMPRDVIDDAERDNSQRDFTLALLAARNPPPKPEYVPPAVSSAVAERTKLEMEAGAARVAEFQTTEVERKETLEAHQRDKRQNPGSTVSVFRPADFVPDQKKGQGNISGTKTDL